MSAFITTIDLNLKNKLKTDLENQGFEFTEPAYTYFSAKKKGISCTLYKSGKLMVQGKEKGPFIEFYLEPEILKEFHFSNPEAQLNLTAHIGLDEAGKGDFFGPLCIAALYADKEGILKLHKMGVKDSKTFTDPKILKLAKEIRENFSFTVIRFFPKKYNELYDKFKNLNRLLAWTHVAALSDLSQKTGCKEALLDQFADKSVVQKMVESKKLDVNLEQKTKGESDTVVAGASILARAAFLDGMQKLSEEYNYTIPKGASQKVVQAAREIQEKFGKEIMPNLVKMHFKTTQKLI